TTAADRGRSSLYATDVAKMVQAPIFHVNGDDPEACVRVSRLAFAYRARFARDVVIDMVCYRRHGHNEADEPAYTQPKMYALIEARRSIRKLYFEAGTVDWALAESLAFGTLLQDGTPIRLAGQDSRRGTFSQRHAVLVDYHNEAEHVPLSVLGRGHASFRIYDSLLSEYAGLGFDYGYSVAHPDTLVLWEAQFGDFVNGGQIIIDQFIVAAEDKWGQESGLVILLPHGFEGQ